jgi:hypothetical protein
MLKNSQKALQRRNEKEASEEGGREGEIMETGTTKRKKKLRGSESTAGLAGWLNRMTTDITPPNFAERAVC